MNQEQLEHLRHSLAHLLAAAVLKLWPSAKRTIGPAIDNGFYYDFEFVKPVTEADLPKIEKQMKKLLPTWKTFDRHDVSVSEAKKEFAGNPYKLELIEEFSSQDQNLTIYQSGEFRDLCRGGHAENFNKVDPDSFKLDKIAGAYWRGSEKNTMLTRIYGLAFATKEELANYLAMMEEAKKRDHRKLGKDLEIFTFSDEIGPGLPIWLPKGTVIKEELEKLAKAKEFEYGYERVATPIIAKEDLFYTSGHLPHFRESMYAPMEIDGENYYLKPMNCPFHHTIYQAKAHSYRELPIRYAEYGLCHRYEKSGELQGLLRVRSLDMNDAHIYVRPDQVKEELKKVLELHKYYYDLFGINKVSYRLSLHDPKDLGGKYVDMPKEWQKNEQILREVLQEMKLDFFEAQDEASFYGPKIDINIYSAIGKEYTVGTTQLDFAQPQRFNLTYIDQQGKEVMPFCIHRAPLSTHERFIGFLLEHYAGEFPLWLSPVQIKIISVGSAHEEFCRNLANKFKQENIRVEADLANETVGNKIRKSSREKIPYTLVIGDKEINADKLAIRVRGREKLVELSYQELVEKIKDSINNRSAELI